MRLVKELRPAWISAIAGAMLLELSTNQMMSTGCCSVLAFSVAVAQAASEELLSVLPKLALEPSPAGPASSTSVVGGGSPAAGGSSPPPPPPPPPEAAQAGRQRIAPTANTRMLLDP